MYKSLIRPILFQFNPESIHNFTFGLLKTVFRFPGMHQLIAWYHAFEDKSLEREVFGIQFKNPIGLAAGFDKDAKLIDELSSFGFGFIEIGTVTPKAQPGNEKPRLFRLSEDGALINRMGFNNEGVEAALERLKRSKSKVVVGGNIGKNKVTPNEEAYRDYEISFETLFEYVDYFVVNVSSPNTPGLRELQEKGPLKNILERLQVRNHKKSKPKPILLKIAPDLSESQLDDILEIIEETKLAGIVAANTTVDRHSLKTSTDRLTKIGNGGLSGKPIKNKSTDIISMIQQKTKGQLPIIAVGGIFSGEDALEKLKAGASLVQVYTGFIYEGPSMVKKINQKIVANK